MFKDTNATDTYRLLLCTRVSAKAAAVNHLADTELQPFNGLFSRTTWVSQYQKGKTNLDFTGARDSEWQWHQLSHMQVCTSLQTDNHASTPPLCFLQAGCPSCRPTNSVKALKADTERPSKPYSLNLTLNPHFFTNNVSSKINVQRAMFNDVINFLNFERQ